MQNMSKNSAGILMYRVEDGQTEVLLVHPGGPFWSRRDERAWSIPKGEFSEDEGALEAAKREFQEETGLRIEGDFRSLYPAKQAGGKTIYAWAVRGDADVTAFRSNMFSLEWPRGSGRIRKFPEVDRAAWFNFEEARRRILKGQVVFLDQLERLVTGPFDNADAES